MADKLLKIYWPSCGNIEKQIKIRIFINFLSMDKQKLFDIHSW